MVLFNVLAVLQVLAVQAGELTLTKTTLEAQAAAHLLEEALHHETSRAQALEERSQELQTEVAHYRAECESHGQRREELVRDKTQELARVRAVLARAVMMMLMRM